MYTVSILAEASVTEGMGEGGGYGGQGDVPVPSSL